MEKNTNKEKSKNNKSKKENNGWMSVIEDIKTPETIQVQITFCKSKKVKTYEVDNSSNLLELAEESDMVIDFGCRAGNCGTCIAALKSGKVAYEYAPETLEPGFCLPCVAIPKTDVILDA